MAFLFVFVIQVVSQCSRYTKSRAILYKFWFEASARQKLFNSIPDAASRSEKSASNPNQRFVSKIYCF